MRRLLIGIVALATCAAACSSSHSAVKHLPPPTTTTIATPAGLTTLRVASKPAQRIDGFGASGAWWPSDLGRFPAATQQLVADMLFSPTAGIALSGYRYYMGGGGKGVTTPARATPQFPHDEPGRYFLRAAANAHVPLLTAFAYAAPQFSTSGKACAGRLQAGQEAAYAQYLADIVVQMHDQDHVDVQYVSPMNEPDDSFPSCGQEGMSVPVAQRAAVVRALGSALKTKAPWAKVIADETTADVIAVNEIPQWLSTPGTAQYVAAIVHHTYDFPNDAIRAQVPKLTQQFHLPTWMTEICCYKGSGGVATSMGAGYDPTMKQGFWLADQIYDDFTIAGDTAWYWWTALSPFIGCDLTSEPDCPLQSNAQGENDGLLYYDEHFAQSGITNIFPTRRYYILGQFARYVRPGALRHGVSGAPKGTRVMAFEQNGSWTVVAWNENAVVKQFGISVPGTPALAVQTNDGNAMLGVGLPARTASGTWVLRIPPRTLVTYVFK